MVYIVFVAHVNLDAAQFFAKPRTYLVSVGVSVLGTPGQDSKGNNISDTDWAGMTILQKIAAFNGNLGIGDTNETGSGIVKSIYVETTIRVTGPKTAASIIANNISCDTCLDAMKATFIAQGFTNSNGDDLLMNISDPYVLRTLDFPISNSAPPSPRRLPAAAAAAALLSLCLLGSMRPEDRP